MTPSGRSSKGSRSAVNDKVAELRRRQARRDRTQRMVIWASAAVAVALVAGVVATSIVLDQRNAPSLGAVASYSPEAGHTEDAVTYEQSPPAGGRHAPVWLNCGAYAAPVKNENAVHSMEHGAVWVTHRPDLPQTQITALRQSLPDTYVVVSPFEGLSSPVVASAWGKQLSLDGVEDPRLTEFIREYRQGANAPEPGAPCSGGIDGDQPA